ncbi:MAG: spore germination protein, partial [Ruminococcus sp.]|nr:spore germination protein [Ruminococcus sp.]
IPKLFNESFQTMDDYCYKPYYATFIRWVKYLAFLTAILLPALYLSIALHHPELLNRTLLLILAEAEQKAPISLTAEAVGVLLVYEIIREAGLRLPRAVGGAVSIVAGLIVGDAAVSSGLISTPMLTVTAIAVISGFVVPDLNQNVTILRLLFLFAGGFLGLFGIGLLGSIVLFHICSSESFGIPFTAPIAPFRKHAFRDVLNRSSFRKMQSGQFTVEDFHE